MIHVCFSLYDKTGLFSKFTGTAILSLCENTISEVTIHIFHDATLSDENRNKIVSIVERYNKIIKFYDVEKLCPDRVEMIKKLLGNVVKMRFTIAAFYRFFMPHILPKEIEKIIYLDSDIIVNLDINELWQIELGDKILGVVTTHSQKLNPPKNDDLYDFNSGVLLMNMQVFRDEEETLNKGIKFMSESTEYAGMEQQILNYCFNKNTVHLPVKFNRLVKWDRRQKIMHIEGKIYHFNHHSSTKGLGSDMSDPFNRLWLSYFIRTPWFSAESIGRLYTQFQQIRKESNNCTLNVSAAMSNKARAFFFEPKKANEMKKVFSIRDNEEIILAKNEESIEKLLKAMKKSAGKKVFFIITGSFLLQDSVTQNFLGKKFPLKRLTDAGFVKDKDFFKGWDFLYDKTGTPFNSYPLIQVL